MSQTQSQQSNSDSKTGMRKHCNLTKCPAQIATAFCKNITPRNFSQSHKPLQNALRRETHKLFTARHRRCRMDWFVLSTTPKKQTNKQWQRLLNTSVKLKSSQCLHQASLGLSVWGLVNRHITSGMSGQLDAVSGQVCLWSPELKMGAHRFSIRVVWQRRASRTPLWPSAWLFLERLFLIYELSDTFNHDNMLALIPSIEWKMDASAVL